MIIVGCAICAAGLLAAIIVLLHACGKRHRHIINFNRDAGRPRPTPIERPPASNSIRTPGSHGAFVSGSFSRRPSAPAVRRHRESRTISYISGPVPGRNRQYLQPYYPYLLPFLPQEHMYMNNNDKRDKSIHLHLYLNNTEQQLQEGKQRKNSLHYGVGTTGEDSMHSPQVRLRRTSIFPDYESTLIQRDGYLLREQNTQSLYPTD